MTDADDVIRERTFHLTPAERWYWNNATSENGGKQIEGAARRRIFDQQQLDATRAEETCRLEAEISAARELAAAPIPSLEDCREQLVTNPSAFLALRDRAEAAYREVRTLPHAPVKRIDLYWEQLNRTLAQLPSLAHAMLRLHQAIRHLAELSADRASFSVMSFSDAQATVASRAPVAPAFDAQNYLGRLIARGIVLVVNPSGKLVCQLPNLLTELDRRTINEERGAILAALSQTEEI
jgi:hypothetical protein